MTVIPDADFVFRLPGHLEDQTFVGEKGKRFPVILGLIVLFL